MKKGGHKVFQEPNSIMHQSANRHSSQHSSTPVLHVFEDDMLEVVFLGVGEAFDEELPNTSILIRYDRTEGPPVTLLLDCGFTAPPQFWKEVTEVEALDGIWISHFHGDHTLGIPALLVRFLEEGRRKPLTFLGQKGIDSFVPSVVDLAYPAFYNKIGFPIRFVEVEPGNKQEVFGLTLSTAENGHSQRDLALRIDAAGKSIFYSGDGRPTPESRILAKETQLIIHEAFLPETEIHGHGTVKGAIRMARDCGASHLALVHIQRMARRQVIESLERLKAESEDLNIFVPEPGFSLRMGDAHKMIK